MDLAVKSVKDNGLRRVQVQCPGRPGIHGSEQGPWYGLGAIARRLRVPGSATMGSMTAYWSTKARINAFDADHFVTQVATMSQIAGELMIANMSELQTQHARPKRAFDEPEPRPCGPMPVKPHRRNGTAV